MMLSLRTVARLDWSLLSTVPMQRQALLFDCSCLKPAAGLFSS
jgi:hypothetical protein